MAGKYKERFMITKGKKICGGCRWTMNIGDGTTTTQK
jgi:hypothetical protein